MTRIFDSPRKTRYIKSQCTLYLLRSNIQSKHPQIKNVIYPKYFSGENKNRVKNYLENGYGALVGFEIEGGKEAGKSFIDALELFYHVANIGDARSLAIHPATTTHSQLNEEDQLRSGVKESYVRLSIGIEHIDDIINDINRGLKASK